MSNQVCSGAKLKCSFGKSTSVLSILPVKFVNTVKQPAAVIMDNIPMVNIAPFGMCSSPTNPAVIAATAAAMGTPTPAPCVPLTIAPWTPGSPKVKIRKLAALTDSCKLNCTWSGMIEVTKAGQTKVVLK